MRSATSLLAPCADRWLVGAARSALPRALGRRRCAAVLPDPSRIVGDRRLDHRDLLRARRGRAADRARFDQRLSARRRLQAARRRLYAGAVAGRRAVGRSDGNPRARRQRAEGSGRRAEEGRACRTSTVPGDLRPRRHPRQDQGRRQGDRRGGQGRRRSPPKVDADLTARGSATRRHQAAQARAVHPQLEDGKILASGTGTAADGIIALAGGVNAVNGFHGLQAACRRGDRHGRPGRHPDDGSRPAAAARRRRSARAAGDRLDAGRPEQAADPDGRRLPARLRAAHGRRRRTTSP